MAFFDRYAVRNGTDKDTTATVAAGAAGAAGAVGATACARRVGRIEAALARSLDDVFQAAPILRRAIARAAAPIPHEQIGKLLSRLTHGGIRRQNGGLILARCDGNLIGFALMNADRAGCIEVAWTYVEGGRGPETLDAIWRAIAATAAEWNLTKLRVGTFVGLPRAFTRATKTA